jgi:arylformamidase
MRNRSKEVRSLAEKKSINKWGAATKSDWIDISIPIRNKMVYWPGDPVPRIERIKDRDKGDGVTLTEMQIIDHIGTHVDAPLHFMAGGLTIDKMPIDATVGRARVIEIKNPVSIELKEVEPYNIRRGERILFKTKNSSRCYKTDEFVPDYTYISLDVAKHLVERGIRVIGLDYLSIGKYGDDTNLGGTHVTFLNGGVYILEGINLAKVKPGRYDMVCLPLYLEKGDAAPARAILRPVK